jgi:hypothetical protein
LFAPGLISCLAEARAIAPVNISTALFIMGGIWARYGYIQEELIKGFAPFTRQEPGAGDVKRAKAQKLFFRVADHPFKGRVRGRITLIRVTEGDPDDRPLEYRPPAHLYEDDRPATERVLGEFDMGMRQNKEMVKRYRRRDGAVVWTKISMFCIPGTIRIVPREP